MDAALQALARYRAAEHPLPTEPGLYQATLRTHNGARIHHMAKVGIDLDGRWFEYVDCRPRLIDPADVVADTLRVVDWSVAPEVRMSCLTKASL